MQCVICGCRRGVAEEAGPSSAAQGNASDGSGEKKESRKRGKKKLPVPDLDAIKDPNERRRQRRLVKNRNTAAASRQAILLLLPSLQVQCLSQSHAGQSQRHTAAYLCQELC